jgi:hypothetical protein
MAVAVGGLANAVQSLGIGWKMAQTASGAIVSGGASIGGYLIKGAEKAYDLAPVIDSHGIHQSRQKPADLGSSSWLAAGKGAADYANEQGKQLDQMMKGQWASDKVDKFFADAKARSAAQLADLGKGSNAAGNSIASTINSVVGSGVKSVQNLAREATKAGEAIKSGMGDGMHQLSAKAIEAQGSITKMIEELKAQNKYFGMDSREAQIRTDFGKGATLGQTSKALELSAQLRGKEIKQETETPFEKFTRELDKLDWVKRRGGIDDQTFQREKTKLTMQLWQGLPQAKFSAGGAMLHDSTEARSAILNARVGRQQNNPQQQLARVAAEQLAQQKDANVWLRKLVDAQPSIAPLSGF